MTKDIQEKMMSKVKEKYNSDRLNAIKENGDIAYYKFKLDSVSAYYVMKDKYFGEQISFCLSGKKISGQMLIDEDEKIFFNKFVSDKLQQEGKEAIIENKNLFNEEDENYINLGYYITCGDVVIDIDNIELLEEVLNVVDNYNKERKNIKIKKLKMEEN